MEWKSQYFLWLVWLIGGVWVTTCTLGITILFILGWTNGDALLLLFDSKGEKVIEMMMVVVGSICATVGGTELVKSGALAWLEIIGKVSI